MEANLKDEILEMLPFWLSLNETLKDLVRETCSIEKLRTGTVLKGGEGSVEGLLMVTKGQIRAYMISQSEKELTLYRLLDRDICIFSSSCMIKGNNMDIFIEAEKDTEVLLLPSASYRKLLNNSIIVSDFTNRLISERFSQVMTVMEQAIFSSFERRLAQFLTEQANIEESNSLAITHEALARHLGTAREVVTRKLKEFAKEGIIEMGRGSILIKDIQKLRNIG